MNDGSWAVWQVSVWRERLCVHRKGSFASRESAVRAALRWGRAETRRGVRYYVRPVGRHLSRDPARYPWAVEAAPAAGSKPHGRGA